MALINNYSILTSSSPGRHFAGTTVSEVRSNYNKSGAMRNRFYGDSGLFFDGPNSIPNGNRPPYCWTIAQNDGGISCYVGIKGTGSISAANLAGGRNATADLSGDGDVTNAALGLILSAVAALSGSGDISADILGKLEAVAALAGSGDVDGAINALAHIASGLVGNGSLDADVIASGSISADIVVSGDVLNSINVGPAVWNAILEGEFTAADIQRIIAAVIAGESSGGPGSPVFRSIDDTADRVSGTSDSNGNRTDVIYTPGG